jgi:hypothetical protein
MVKKAEQANFSKPASAKLTIFLSHSHKDRKAAEGMIKRLAAYGVELFVDWNDSEMPRVINRETADRIKRRIGEMDLFLMLATGNAMNSRWVPWEVGVADKTKGESKILIIPVEDASGNFQGSEYLRLYRRVLIPDQGGLGVFEPDETRGIHMENFIKSAAGV